jgi:putative effector of murein hydrolase LrgA (UPF0299 family)
MKRISNRWMTVIVVFVVASQCCCCIVTPVSVDAMRAYASAHGGWASAAQALP